MVNYQYIEQIYVILPVLTRKNLSGASQLNNNQVQPARKRTGRVLADYQAAYPDPITTHIGEELQLNGQKDNWKGWIWLWCSTRPGRSGWIPAEYVEILQQS